MPSANRLPSAKQTLTAFSKLRIKLLFQLSRRYDVFIKGCLQSIQLGLFVLQCRHCFCWLWYCSTCPVSDLSSNCKSRRFGLCVKTLRSYIIFFYYSEALTLRSPPPPTRGGWLAVCVLVELIHRLEACTQLSQLQL